MNPPALHTLKLELLRVDDGDTRIHVTSPFLKITSFFARDAAR